MSEEREWSTTEIETQLLEYLDNRLASLMRARRLITIAEKIESQSSLFQGDVDSPLSDAPSHEILRAVIVLTHAYLEESLRALGRILLPFAPKNVLDDIPLAGTQGRAAAKILLGSLRAHRDETVEGLIQNSIDEHLEHRSFNNGTEVSRFLAKLGVDIPSSDLGTINDMIQRRHRIAHRADRLWDEGSQALTICPISSKQALNWVSATDQLMSRILNKVAERYSLRPRWAIPNPPEPKTES